MRHDYYYYDREQLLAAPKVPIEVLEDNAAVFRAIAREMADEIKRKNGLGETTVFICPVGPVGQYPYFVDIVNGENISLKNVWFLNMDEYLTGGKVFPINTLARRGRFIGKRLCRPTLSPTESSA